MAIVKRVRKDGSAAYRVVVHTPTQGHISIGTFDRKKDAELAEAEYKRSSRLEGVVFVPKKVAVIDLSAEWLRSKRVKPQTLSAYKGRCEHINDHFGNQTVTSIDRAACEVFMGKLNERLAPRTANVVFKVFRQMLQYAVECAYIKQNPSLGVKVNRVRAGRELHIMSPEAHQTLVAASCEHFRSLVYLLPLTGLRMGEAIALSWDCVDLFKRELRVSRQKLKSGGFAETKTEKSDRVVRLSKPAVKELRRWKAQCPPSKDNLVFPTPWGTVMSYSYFYENVIYPLRSVEGFENITTHDFRHTFVSWLISAGADIKYVQDQCGHASATVTLDTYGHLFNTHSHAIADHMGDWYVTAALPQQQKAQVSGTEG